MKKTTKVELTNKAPLSEKNVSPKRNASGVPKAAKQSAIEKLAKVVIANLTPKYGGECPDDLLKPAKSTLDILSRIVHYCAGALTDDDTLFCAKWLGKNFTDDELLSCGIITHGDVSNCDDIPDLPQLYLLGDTYADFFYYQSESKRFTLGENAKIRIESSGNAFIAVEAYGNNKVDMQCSGFSKTEIFANGGSGNRKGANIKLDLSGLSSTEIHLYGHATCRIGANDLSGLHAYIADSSTLDIICEASVRAAIEMRENARLIIDGESNQTYISGKAGNNNIFRRSDSNPITLVPRSI